MKKIIKYVKFFIAISLFFFSSLLRYIPIFIFNIDIKSMSIKTNGLLTGFSNVVSFIILVLMYRKDIVEAFKDLKKKKFKPLLIAFDYWFIGLMIMVFSNVLITYLNKGATSNNEESVRLLLKALPILTTLSVSFISPFIEELVFRQSFRDIFKNKWIYLATSGLLFGSLHVFLAPINSWVDYLYLIPYCSMGVAFAYTQYKTNNILASTTMHVFHNTLNVISTLFFAGVIIW